MDSRKRSTADGFAFRTTSQDFERGGPFELHASMVAKASHFMEPFDPVAKTKVAWDEALAWS